MSREKGGTMVGNATISCTCVSDPTEARPEKSRDYRYLKNLYARLVDYNVYEMYLQLRVYD